MPSLLRKLEIAVIEKRARGGNIWGEMSPPESSAHPLLAWFAGPVCDPVGSVWGGAEGVRGSTLDATTAASEKGPSQSAVRIMGCGACPRPWWAAGGRRVFGFGPRCAEVSARRNSHSHGQVAAAIDAAAVSETSGANPLLQNYLLRA